MRQTEYGGEMPKRSLLLPAPPSSNVIWRIRGDGEGLYKSKHYTTWIEEVKWLFMASGLKAERLEGKIRLSVVVNMNLRRDLSNILKPIEDALEACGAFVNDRQVKKIRMDFMTDRADIPKGFCLAEWDEIE